MQANSCQPVHYLTDPDCQHRSSRWCHIQQDGRSAASPSLLVVVLHAVSDIPASSFHNDCAGHSYVIRWTQLCHPPDIDISYT